MGGRGRNLGLSDLLRAQAGKSREQLLREGQEKIDRWSAAASSLPEYDVLSSAEHPMGFDHSSDEFSRKYSDRERAESTANFIRSYHQATGDRPKSIAPELRPYLSEYSDLWTADVVAETSRAGREVYRVQLPDGDFLSSEKTQRPRTFLTSDGARDAASVSGFDVSAEVLVEGPRNADR